jgi:hypothetical protein
MFKHSNLSKKILNLVSAIAVMLAAVFLVGNQAEAATVGSWTISGPGTTSVSGPNPSPTFSYSVDPAGFNTVQWTASTTALTSGQYKFDWNYSGFHAYYDVTAFLTKTSPDSILVSAGPQNCCTTPSNGFGYSGRSSFSVTAGDTIAFTFGGRNFDSNNVLRGTLSISAVPVPATGLLLISALAGVGALKRRRKAAAA